MLNDGSGSAPWRCAVGPVFVGHDHSDRLLGSLNAEAAVAAAISIYHTCAVHPVRFQAPPVPSLVATSLPVHPIIKPCATRHRPDSALSRLMFTGDPPGSPAEHQAPSRHAAGLHARRRCQAIACLRECLVSLDNGTRVTANTGSEANCIVGITTGYGNSVGENGGARKRSTFGIFLTCF